MTWQLPVRKVLVPFDFSPPSFEALTAALSLVSKPSDLHALYVAPLPGANSPSAIWGDFDDEHIRARAGKAMAEELDADFPEVQRHVGIGDAGDQIVAHAKANAYDLIVIPSHGRSGFSRWVIGSVAERVVRHSPCPVLVLRRPAQD